MSAFPSRPHRLAMPPTARPRRRAPALHPAGCPCCRPAAGPAGADAPLTGNAIAGWSLAGAGVGIAIVQAHAWLTAGPGLAVLFGAGR